MSKQRHIIGRTVLELDTGNLADVWSLQQDVSRLLQQQIVPEMERLFDQLVGDDRVVRLDRVVVEVGSVDRRFLADEFVQNLLATLHQNLSDRLANLLLDTETITRDRTGADWEVLLYFLQYGRLPWWVSSGDWQAWFPRWEAVMQTETAWRTPLQELLATNQGVRQRLVEQLPEFFRHQLILQVQPAWTLWATLLAQAQQLIQSLELSSSAVRYLDRQAWLLLLSEIAPDNAQERPFPAATWSRNWLAQLVQTWQQEALIEEQRLRTSIEALPIAQRSLWLTALDQVPNLTPTQDSENLSRDRPRTDWEVLLYFLSYGRLPGGQPSEDLLTWLPRWEAIMQSETHWQQPLRELLTTNPAARQRLIAQLPEAFRHQLVLQLQPAWTIWHILMTQARRIMQSLSLNNDTCEQLQQQAWLLLLAEIGLDNASGQTFPVASWTRNWLTQLVQIWQLQAPDMFNLLTETSRPVEEAEPIQNRHSDSQETSDRQHLRTIIEALPIAESPPWLTALNQVLSADTTKRSLELREAATSPINEISPEEETAGLFVNQAGLVLLHPFLRTYFDEVGLLNGESFRDESAQQTAIYLLHYLATKQTDVPEYELVLPKLLCGWSLNEPMSRGLDLPATALIEGEYLLQTVIDYWQALKSASPDGLREGFLQRAGKLTRSNDGNWKVQVEQQPIDILLSRLPWGMSMVKLPWMEDILIVEWH
ncbi:contractile injection system tape measure protein [Dendronalium sp. ChiSLP03b]|uniref:contractile injection system tape measure protein n=1 Tax=Dendronalium sp. ChiSLP03b TaxID=3075381 RepID=UPI002AD4CDE5|nr:contractile injection system tape measure protein [Dendronalium sp. ChiSLP03b]MDZ8203793.1 contractile injection system tape measure protein [Dendronalium sp. ChiSLP03b]